MIPEIDFLRKIYIFQDLVDQELEFIAQIMTPREFPSGELVIEEGKQGDSMYVIAEGEVQVFKSLTMKFGEDDFRETEKTLITLRAEDHVVIRHRKRCDPRRPTRPTVGRDPDCPWP